MARAKSRQNKKQKSKPSIKPMPVNLALQGGGAHGAFTWGVLDKFLEDNRIDIEAISGTSAGAMNAIVIADGLMESGNEGARKALRNFWKAVSDAATMSPLKRTPFDVLTGNWNLDNSPGYIYLDLLSRLYSPYQINPMNINPLRDLMISQIDFKRVRSCDRMKLFISATRVRDGKVQIFNRSELTADMIMASACLPFLFQAVEIDGEAYWDGGYMGNPVLYPFAYRCTCSDVIIIQINPLCCQKTPKSAREILNRVNEITFNGSLLKELRAIDFVARLVDEGALDPLKYKKMLIHIISGEEAFKPFNASSKMNAEWGFIKHLHSIGWNIAEKWLDKNFDKIGRESTVDLRAMFG
jgi:NTE family protein